MAPTIRKLVPSRVHPLRPAVDLLRALARPSTSRRALRRGRRAARASLAADVATKPAGWVDRWGLVTAQLFGWAALGPSLIPRRWWMTALTLALSQISGYVAGRTLHLTGRGIWFAASRVVALGALGRFARARLRLPTLAAHHDHPVRTRAAALLGALVGVGTVASLRASVTRQAEIANLVQARMPATREQVAGIAAGMVVATAALALEWGRLAVTNRLRTRIGAVAPRAVAAGLGIGLPVVAIAFVSDRTVRRVWRRLLRAAVRANELDVGGVARPLTALRSGSPSSPVAWSSLGRHGRAFVGSGHPAAAISAATGRRAVDPIRVFASVASGHSIAGAARAAARELRRTGAYDRSVLVLATSTGTGWLSDWSIGAVEHLTDGNCATASLQYTVLPSGLAAIGRPHAPLRATAALQQAVEAELATRPPGRRPRLVVTGESLGALGVLGAFDSIDDLLARVDGGVIAGAPRISRHWNELVARRDDGSPEIVPVVDGGRHVRFASRPAELAADSARTRFEVSQPPRLAVLQHASDPIVWWSPRLLVRRPDWLREPRARDVTPRMTWLPVVTFWQVTTGMPASVDTPGGVAHRYFDEYVPAWARVLDVPVDDVALARIAASIRRSRADDERGRDERAHDGGAAEETPRDRRCRYC